MKRYINMTSSPDDQNRFQNPEDLEAFYKKFGCDGLEYMFLGNEENCKVKPHMVGGLHMRFFNSWMDLWTGNREALLKEYGSFEQVKNTYGGYEKSALIRAFKEDFRFAKKIGAKYTVFHVSEVKMDESFRYCFSYTDEEVIHCVSDLINEGLDGEDGEIYFLMENLWWPGFTFTNPEMTAKLLEKVHYKKKGIMLDTGHLLHTNLELNNQEEGLAYIHQMLEKHGDLCKWIKGIHLNQSITGMAVKEMLSQNISLAERYEERWCQVYEYIFKIDLHQPFTAAGIQKLIQRIEPDFLTYELISRNRQEHEKLLKMQEDALQNMSL